MASRSLNKVQLIGNLTRDPELRYTPSGTPVCSMGLATNRYWTTDKGEKKEDVEFHRLTVWAKLAELCSQLLFKGRKVYIEGRLQTSKWEDKEKIQRQSTEVVVDNMIILDNKRKEGLPNVDDQAGKPTKGAPPEPPAPEPKKADPELKQDAPAQAGIGNKTEK